MKMEAGKSSETLVSYRITRRCHNPQDHDINPKLTCLNIHKRWLKSVYKLDYGLDDRRSIPGTGNDGTFFSSPPRPQWLWGPPSLLSNGYWGLLPGV